MLLNGVWWLVECFVLMLWLLMNRLWCVLSMVEMWVSVVLKCLCMVFGGLYMVV